MIRLTEVIACAAGGIWCTGDSLKMHNSVMAMTWNRSRGMHGYVLCCM
jgi:hypothetical protein